MVISCIFLLVIIWYIGKRVTHEARCRGFESCVDTPMRKIFFPHGSPWAQEFFLIFYNLKNLKIIFMDGIKVHLLLKLFFRND